MTREQKLDLWMLHMNELTPSITAWKDMGPIEYSLLSQEAGKRTFRDIRLQEEPCSE